MKMLTAMLLATVVIPFAVATDDAIKSERLDFKVYTRPYFEKNTSGLKGDASFLAITDQKSFEMIFGVGFVMGQNAELLPKDAFDKQLVLALIKRGASVSVFKVESVTVTDGVVTVKYSSEQKKTSANTKFNSVLIVAVPKGNYKSAVFIDNGQKAGTAEINK